MLYDASISSQLTSMSITSIHICSMQHYGDLVFLERTLDKHFKWLQFLHTHFDSGMKRKGYDEELKDYWKSGSGLGDWLGFRQVSCFDDDMFLIPQ